MKYRIIGKYKNNRLIYKVQENPLFGFPLFWTTVTYWGPEAPHPDLAVPGCCTINCVFSDSEDAEKCLNGLMNELIQKNIKSLENRGIVPNFRLWNIFDSKDGDILFAKGSYFKEYVFIYSGMTEDNVMSTYCGFDMAHNNFDTKLSRFGRMEDFETVCPATKEQRDLLFQKMKEAGYEWDAEKKELKKISKQHLISNYFNAEYERGKADALKSVAWSEEDELYIRELESLVKQVWARAERENDKETIHKMSDLSFFLKTLKPQLKQEWSDEDERMYRGIHNLIYSTPYCDSRKEFSDWLKSLKERYTWKPSDEHYELEEFAKIVRGNLTGISKAVQELFEAKYLQLTGNKMYGGFKD